MNYLPTIYTGSAPVSGPPTSADRPPLLGESGAAYIATVNAPKPKPGIFSAIGDLLGGVLQGGAQGVQQVELIEPKTPSQIPFYVAAGALGIGGLALLFWIIRKR